MAAIEFWFEFASTYSYPAAMRIEALARDAGVSVVYRPFLLGPIFASQGWKDSPFNIYPEKGKYMWRDLKRICDRHALGLQQPSVFPRNGLAAARVALLAADEPWGPAYVRAVYTANFALDRDIGKREVIAAILSELGQDANDLLARAETPDIKTRLRAQTTAAQARGIFGAPSFVVGAELFWGHDRLLEALEWSLDPAN